jgi:hypothetical protein
VNAKHRKVVEAILTRPTLADIVFRDIEALLIALGCEVHEGAGSRVAFVRGSLRLYLHRPHPGKEAKRYQVESVREFPEKLNIGAVSAKGRAERELLAPGGKARSAKGAR